MSGSNQQHGAGLPLASQQRIDQLCMEFEDAWHSGKGPRIESYLDRVEEAERGPLLEELLLLELEYAPREGEGLSCEAYASRFPAHAETIRRVFARRPAESERPAYAAGSRIGRYVLQEQLGEGAFGTVYVAWDEELERAVAIKIPRWEILRSPAETDRIVSEARAAAKLQHPAIVAVHDVLRDQAGTPLIVMEYVPGVTLRERIQAGRLPLSESLHLVIQLAEAMEYAHLQGFVHRDLEPGNILLDEAGRPRISDFGLAIHESVQRSKPGESAGSLAYMSPEQVIGDSQWIDGRADLWALGVILYQLLTGRRPFDGDDADQVTTEILWREPKALRQIDGQIPPELERICLKCLRKPVAERYATGGDLAADLRAVQANLEREAAASALAASSQDVSKRRPRCSPLALGLACLALAAAGYLLACWIARGRPPRVPAQGTTDVRVWNAEDPCRRGVSVRDPSVLPLRPGDQVRLEVQVSMPLYVYLLWIDSRGGVSPVYPWLGGDWKRRPPCERTVTAISLPAPSDQGWTVEESPSGMETIVLLASKTPFPRHVDFAARLGSLEPQLGTDYPSVVELQDGRFLPARFPPARSLDLRRATDLDDPILKNQQSVLRRLGNQFVLCYAISFPVRASPGGNHGS